MAIPQQSTYTRPYNDRIVGQPSDSDHQERTTKLNNEGAAIPAGVAVTENAEGKCDLVDASTDKIAGVVINDYTRDPNGLTGSEAYGDAKMFPLMVEGGIMVVVDGTVTVGGEVYVRHTANGAGKLQLGAFRGDADGVAQVTTLTPTAANTTLYSLMVEAPSGALYSFNTTSDGSATATEINDALRVLMAADSAFTAEIVASGTATLILTAVAAGKAFKVFSFGPGVIAQAATTPPAPHARKVPGSYWLSGGDASTGKAELQFSRAGDAP